MKNEMIIDDRRIGSQYPPYVIAEMSANHNGNLDRALRIMDEAKSAGVDAIKLQTYRPDTITLNCDKADFQIKDGLWAGRSLYELYEWAHTPWDWHAIMFKYAKKIGITIFSSPFDKMAVDLLEELGAPAYKVASFEANDINLIRYIASTGKPMIISTGMTNVEEIYEAINAAQIGGCKQLALLRCVSGYPAPPSDYNLLTIPDMIRRFGLIVGLSDHTLDNTTAVASVALGASIIEKHFTLNRNEGGPDDSFSLEPKELTQLCQNVHSAWDALGCVNYGLKSSEIGNVKFRRSLYFIKPLKAGDRVSSESIRSVRPGYGLAPKYMDEIIGAVLKSDVEFGMPVSWDLFER